MKVLPVEDLPQSNQEAIAAYAANQSSPFLRLPLELRHEIYRLTSAVIDDLQYDDEESDEIWVNGATLGLYQTCRQVRLEVNDLNLTPGLRFVFSLDGSDTGSECDVEDALYDLAELDFHGAEAMSLSIGGLEYFSEDLTMILNIHCRTTEQGKAKLSSKMLCRNEDDPPKWRASTRHYHHIIRQLRRSIRARDGHGFTKREARLAIEGFWNNMEEDSDENYLS